MTELKYYPLGVALVVMTSFLFAGLGELAPGLTGTITSATTQDGTLAVSGKVTTTEEGEEPIVYLVVEITEGDDIYVMDEIDVEGVFTEEFSYGAYTGSAYAVVLYETRTIVDSDDEDVPPKFEYSGELARKTGVFPEDEEPDWD